MGQLKLGQCTISPIAEIEYCKVDISFLYNDLSLEDMQRNGDWLDTDAFDIENGKLGFSFRSYLIQLGGVNILVDACNGNHKERPTAKWQHQFDRPDFLDTLAAAGVKPEDVNCVICTHLHCDHVGWLTQLEKGRWTPTFPNATHFFSRKEYDFFRERFTQLPSTAVNHGSFEDSVMPVIDSGKFRLVELDAIIVDRPEGQVRLVPSPGHSIGHVSISIQSEGQEAIVCGDALHHPIQLDMPLMAMRSDFDVELAQRSRIELLEHCASTGAWLLAGHFCKYPSVQIEKHGNVYRIKKPATQETMQ